MAKHKYIETPQKMWELFEKYVEHEVKNPMHKVEYVGRDGSKALTPLPTPITFEGFECYLADKNIIADLGHYSANTNGDYEDYRTIITRIRNNCFVNNFKGAAVGLFNANLIAKKLGLIDKQELKTEGKIKISFK